MTTFDGVYQLCTKQLHLWNTSILNYSRLPTRRMDVPVGIAYEDDVERAMALLLDHLKQDSRILSDPGPQVRGYQPWRLFSRSQSALLVGKRSNFWTLKFELNKNAKLWLDAAGISIPFPQRDVHLIPTSDDGSANPTGN